MMGKTTQFIPDSRYCFRFINSSMSRLLKPIGGFVKVILSLKTPHGQYILQVVPFAFLLSLYQASGGPIK